MIVMRPAELLVSGARAGTRAARIITESSRRTGCGTYLLRAAASMQPRDRHRDLARSAPVAFGARAGAERGAEHDLDRHSETRGVAIPGEPALERVPARCAGETATAPGRDVDGAARAQIPDEARDAGVGDRDSI